MATIDQGAFSSRIPHFFDLLSKFGTSIPVESQWVVWIQQFPEVIIKRVLQFENYPEGDVWTNIGPTISRAVADPLQKIKGCIFANQVSIPGESVAIDHAGEGYRGGYVKGPLTTARAEFGNLTINFVETNLSFGDLVMRPWAIMVGHLGLLARETDDQNHLIKTNINVYHLAKAGAGKPMVIRKQFNFYNCVPISVSSEEYNYEGASQTKMRQVEFLYSYYTSSTSPSIARGDPDEPITPRGPAPPSILIPPPRLHRPPA
jgi:hypothetical protein